VVVEKVKTLPKGERYDAAKGVHRHGQGRDHDPTKVTRSAVQNAASIAGLLLTTEALVADKPEKAPPMPAMPPGGGMGGMGGMGMM